MKRFSLIIACVIALCALPSTMSARTSFNFSVLFDMAGIFCPRPCVVVPVAPAVVERHIIVEPGYYPCCTQTTIIKEYRTPYYERHVVIRPGCHYYPY